MNKEKIEIEYNEHFSYYVQLQKEVFDLLNEIVDDDEYKNIDVAEIKQRPKNEIKSIESIFKNIDRPDKYNSCSNLYDIKDIAGVRVICHCDDDLLAFAEIIENVLSEKRYLDVKREDKGGTEERGIKQKSRPSYRAIHITCARLYIHNRIQIKVYCEIQLRTVMGDAWAVQDRKYIYGQIVSEGDRHILTDSVSEIMNGCEGLWSLVKKKYKDGSEIKTEEYKIIEKTILAKARIIKSEDAKIFDVDLKKDNL